MNKNNKSFYEDVAFLCIIIVFSLITSLGMMVINNSADHSEYFLFRDNYYIAFQPTGNSQVMWYEYNEVKDNWEYIDELDLPYQLGVKQNRNKYIYSRVWEEGSPFSDFKNSSQYGEYLNSKKK